MKKKGGHELETCRSLNNDCVICHKYGGSAFLCINQTPHEHNYIDKPFLKGLFPRKTAFNI